MRIHSSAQWLLTASLAAKVAAQATGYVNFNSSDFAGAQIESIQSSIFEPQVFGQQRTFRWISNTSLTIQEVRLVRSIPENASVSPAGQPSYSDPASFSISVSTIPTTDTRFSAGGSVTLSVSNFGALCCINDATLITPLFFQVDFEVEVDGLSKRSLLSGFSQEFAVAKQPDTAFSTLRSLTVGMPPASTALTVASTMVAATAIPTDASVPSTTLSGGLPSQATTTASPTSTASTASTSSASSGGKSSGSGLSTGAIVGIAIGAAAAVAIAAALIWFLCFRRRRGDGVRNVPYGVAPNGPNTQELVAEKEAGAGMGGGCGDSPSTPYSEDAHRLRGVAIGMRDLNANESGVDMTDGSVNVNSGAMAGMGNGSAMSRGISMDSPRVVSSMHDGMGLPVQQQEQEHLQRDRPYSPYVDHPSSPASPHQAQVGTSVLTPSPHFASEGAGAAAPMQRSPPSRAYHAATTGTGDDQASVNSTGFTPPRPPAVQQRRSMTPSGHSAISGRYAHLVEEGMTDEEIRRLEEEERQLDQAIEEAGRGR